MAEEKGYTLDQAAEEADQMSQLIDKKSATRSDYRTAEEMIRESGGEPEYKGRVVNLKTAFDFLSKYCDQYPEFKQSARRFFDPKEAFSYGRTPETTLGNYFEDLKKDLAWYTTDLELGLYNPKSGAVYHSSPNISRNFGQGKGLNVDELYQKKLDKLDSDLVQVVNIVKDWREAERKARLAGNK